MDWDFDCEESWAPKNWCFWTVVLEKTLESPLDCKEIQLVHSKGDQSCVFFGRTDAKAKTPVLWSPLAKRWLIGKDSDVGGIGGRRRGQQRMRWLDGITDWWTWVWVNSGSWWWIGRPGVLQFIGSQSRTPLSDWTELNTVLNYMVHPLSAREGQKRWSFFLLKRGKESLKWAAWMHGILVYRSGIRALSF